MTKASSYMPALLGKIPHRSSLSEARGEQIVCGAHGQSDTTY